MLVYQRVYPAVSGVNPIFSLPSDLGCQDDILRLLATSEGDVLEDDTLVDKVWEWMEVAPK